MLCDTCVGGSTVADRLAAHVYGARAFYLADYAVNPLGTKSALEVGVALGRWVSTARQRSDQLIVACNTASVRLCDVPDLAQAAAADLGRLRVTSMLDCLDAAIAARQREIDGASVCLMGTRFTVSHPAYRERLLRAGAGEVIPLAATRTESAVARLAHAVPSERQAIIEEIGDRVRHADVVVLACTCFPLIADLVRQLNPACVLIDPASGLPDALGSAVRGRKGGRNRLVVGVSGGDEKVARVRAHALELFPRWHVEAVVAVAPA